MSTPETDPTPPRSQLEGLGKRRKKPKKAPDASSRAAKSARRAARKKAPAAEREHPSAIKLMAVVALIVALDILLFFAIGYLLGKQIL